MRYTNDIIEEVRARSDIVDIISQYVKLTRKGGTYFGLCPFHNEKTPSFSVTPSKQMYYCFGCGAGGNVYTFLMEYENFTFLEAVEYLAKKAGMELPRAEYSKEAQEAADRRTALLKINKLAGQYYFYELRGSAGTAGMEYLTNRGVSKETMQKFGLGYAGKNTSELYRYLKSKNYSDELLMESGLFVADETRGIRDKFWNRVMFPIMDANNKVIGFGGRVMGDGKPKYLNSPETKLFDKSRNLYGLNIARSTRKNYLLLCEGYMDVIAMHQAGYTNAVASLGTALTAGHASLLRRYTEEVFLLYDSDEAGVRAALRGILTLKEAGITARVVSLQPYKDPDEFLKAEGSEAFEKRLEEASNSFLFRIEKLRSGYDMKDPKEKTDFFRETARRLLEFPDELERNNYIEAIAEKYRVASGDLQKLVHRLALEGTPAVREKREAAAEKQKKKENGKERAQKLLLTWLVTYPEIFSTVEKYICPSDFTQELYRKTAELLYAQQRAGKLNPAALLDEFPDAEEQREVASMFHAVLHLETPEEQKKAFRDTVLRIRHDSLRQEEAERAPGDIAGMQRAFQKKRELEKLGRELERLSLTVSLDASDVRAKD